MTPKPSADQIDEIPLPLPGGTAVLSYPRPITEEDFEWIKTMLDRLKSRMVSDPNPSRTDTEPAADA